MWYLILWLALSIIVALIVGPIIDRMGRREEEEEDYRWNDHQ